MKNPVGYPLYLFDIIFNVIKMQLSFKIIFQKLSSKTFLRNYTFDIIYII